LHGRGESRSKAGDSKGSTRSRSRNNSGRTKRTRHHADRDSKTGCNRGNNPTKPDGRKSGSSKSGNNPTKPDGRKSGSRKSGSSKSGSNTPEDNRNGSTSSAKRRRIGLHRRSNMGEANGAPSGRSIARTTGNPSTATGRNAAATMAIAFQRAAIVATSVRLTLSGYTGSRWR
jgi:hypothetical protein